jgi:hypothetical protein
MGKTATFAAMAFALTLAVPAARGQSADDIKWIQQCVRDSAG